MSSQDENETQGVVFGVLAGVIFGVIALVAGLGVWKASQSAPAAMVAAESDIAPVGEALAKVYFAVGSAALGDGDLMVVARTVDALAAKSDGIVLLSGFHDASGDPQQNAELARQRAQAVRDALLAGGVAAEKVRMRRPESTLGSGSAEEGRRVEIRVQ
ncbi:OmpA family protein [Azonexus caeni]|jgi:outer membrane protein OmpA-like peptidoglycan-associated protein|uniref:OmpA family protein n=1 Tax=Azonexus caeni TaxID=266126 RepID=UPI002C5271D3|nr:OmpA family protein [Azonexus sp.]